MIDKNRVTCLHGVAGWRHVGWEGRFYPDDMPREWMLAYYNTQFDCVWLDRESWLSAPLDEISQWLEDTHAGFRFLLEAPEEGDARAAARLALLGPRLALVGRPDHPRLVWFDRSVDLRGLSERLRAMAVEGQSPILLSVDGDLDSSERVRTLVGLLGL